MATLTTIRTGDFTNTTAGVTPWTALTGAGTGGIPGAGDTVVVATTHVLTIDQNADIGNNTSATYLTISGTAEVKIAPTKTLTVRGNTACATGTIRLCANSIFEFGCTAANAFVTLGPTGGILRTQTGTDAPTAGNRATVRAISGSQLSFFTGTALNFNCVYTTFSAIGSAATPGLSAGGGTVATGIFDHCIFDGCGRILLGSATSDSTGTYSMTYCTVRNPLNSAAAFQLYLSGSLTSGTRVFSHNVIDGVFTAQSLIDVTAVNNQFWGEIGTNNTPGVPVTWSGNLFGITSISSKTYSWNRTNEYVYNARTSADDNVHLYAAISTQGSTLDGCIVDMPFLQNGSQGELFVPSQGPYTYTVKNCLLLPIMVGNAANSFANKGTMPVCVLDTNGTAGGQTYVVSHNTLKYNRVQGDAVTAFGTVYNENVNSSAGSLAANTIQFKSNLVWCTNGSGTYAVCNHATGTGLTGIDNILAPADADYNAWYGLGVATSGVFGAKTNVGTPYYSQMAGGSPDVHGVALVAAPAFVDDTRNLITWYRVKAGLSGRTDSDAQTDSAAAQVLMKAVNDDGADATYTATTLYSWVADGWRPTTASLKNAGHDGVTIGALEGVFGTHSLMLTGCGN